MQRLKNFAISSLIVALLVFPLATSSHNQRSAPAFSSQMISQPATLQRSSTPATKFVRAEKRIPNRYIVVLEDDVVADNLPIESRRARVAAIADGHAKTHRGKVDYIYETALKGYAIELPNEAAAIAISNSPRVRWVEEDGYGEWAQAPASPHPSTALCLPSKSTGAPLEASLAAFNAA